MPERWERELKKIGDLQPNERSVRSRTAEGPSGARLRAGRERLLAGIVGIAVFVAAIAFSWDALISTRPDGDAVGGGVVREGPALMIVANAQPDQEHAPEAQARYGEVVASIPVQGGEGWGIGNAFPAAMFGPHEAAIPVGAPVVFESNAESVEVGFTQSYPDGDSVPQELSPEGMATLPSEPGELQIQLSATWPEGRAEFSVFINLYEPADALDVDCRAHRVPVWQSRVVRAQPDGIHATFQTDAPREVRIDAPGFTSEPITTLQPGFSTLELAIPPGIATIACNNAPASQITVVDPRGLWVPSELGCAPQDDVLPVTGEIDERLIDEVEIVRRLLALEGSDEIRPPGYPDSIRALLLPSRLMVRRDGQVVAKLDVWLGKPARVEGEVCSSIGLEPRTTTEPSPEPDAPRSDVLTIRCGDAGAEVLTPVVNAHPDGVHIDVENRAGAPALAFALADASNMSFGGPIGRGVSVWPIEPGHVFVECLAKMSDTYQGLRTARFEVVDPNGYWVPSTLQCAEADRPLEVSVHDSVQTEWPDDQTAIRGSLHSVQPSDEVRLPFYPEGTGSKDLRHVVVRDGRVVAVLLVGLSDEQDPYGPGLTEVTGEACASSGIAQGSLS
jgi:hypothetical protein